MKTFSLSRILPAIMIAAVLAGPESAVPQVRRLLDGEIEVALNPTGIAPLSAVATFQTRRACDVRMRVPGREEVVHYFSDNSLSHTIPVLGLYAGRVNIVFLTLIPRHGTPETKIVTVTTDPLPAFLPDIAIETSDPARMEPGMTLCDLAILKGRAMTTYPIIFDRYGEIRWYLDLSAEVPGFCVPFERLSNGNFVFGMGESIYEYDMLGRQAARIEAPFYNFHHDIREIPGNLFLAAVDKEDTSIVNSKGVKKSIEDHIIAIDRGTGRIVNEWDLRKILDVRRNEQVNSQRRLVPQQRSVAQPHGQLLDPERTAPGGSQGQLGQQARLDPRPAPGLGAGGRDSSGRRTSPFS